MSGRREFAVNKHALIVGGSRGIGLALVQALLADTAFDRITAASRAPFASAELRRLAAEHRGRLGLLTLDVRYESGLERAADELRAGQPALHLLVNTAGLLHNGDVAPERRLAEVTPENLLRSYAVNAIGPLLIAKHFQSLLTHSDRAVLANISARVGSITDNRLGGWYAYRAAKAAQNQMTRTLAIELARQAPNLICVALHPGTVDTDLSRPFQGNVAADKLFAPAQSAAYLLKVIASLGRESSGRFYAWDGTEIPW